jgi:hypothetical protein
MFKAIGVAGRKLENGDIEVIASIQRDNGAEIAKATFTGADVPTVRARILDELNRRAANEQDAALSAAVVGKLLAQV